MASKLTLFALVALSSSIETVIEVRVELLSYSQDENSAGVSFSFRLFVQGVFDESIFKVTLDENIKPSNKLLSAVDEFYERDFFSLN